MPLSSGLSEILPDEHTVLYIEENLSRIRLIEEILHERTHIEFLNAREGQIGLDLARQRHPIWSYSILGFPICQDWMCFRNCRARKQPAVFHVLDGLLRPS